LIGVVDVHVVGTSEQENDNIFHDGATIMCGVGGAAVTVAGLIPLLTPALATRYLR
jgi:hypothetical protein